MRLKILLFGIVLTIIAILVISGCKGTGNNNKIDDFKKEVTIINCNHDIQCFIDNIKTCTPSKFMTELYEVKGGSTTACEIYTSSINTRDPFGEKGEKDKATTCSINSNEFDGSYGLMEILDGECQDTVVSINKDILTDCNQDLQCFIDNIKTCTPSKFETEYYLVKEGSKAECKVYVAALNTMDPFGVNGPKRRDMTCIIDSNKFNGEDGLMEILDGECQGTMKDFSDTFQ